MRIACLQFAPQVGEVDNNLSRADAILERADPKNLDLLVLPSLAFSGYNFKSLNHISRFLEPTGKGISSLWARTTALKHDCVVTVGYPEAVDITGNWPANPEYYNSAITFSAEGEHIANYRKTFLYYTDETWALEGPDGFYDGVISGLGNVAMGICMDLNPYRFQAPWHAWEFANHVLYKEANLVILSMSWLKADDGQLLSCSRDPKKPDMETLAYWLSRLEPLIRSEQEGEIIVVFANRCGREDEAVYAGTSAVLGIEGGEVKVYGILGSGESELLIIDTSEEPQARLVTEPSSTPADYGTHNWDSSSSATRTPEEVEYPASINEILSASKPKSPVEPRFTQPLKTEKTPLKLNTSACTGDTLKKRVSSTSDNISKSKRSSTHSSIASSVQSSLPPSIQSSMPSSDHSSITSPLPIIIRPDSGEPRTTCQNGTPQRSEPPLDIKSRNTIHNSIIVPMATLVLGPSSDDGTEPTSASSMTTNTPWDKVTNPFPNEEKINFRNPSPASRNPSPFIAALQQAGTPQSQRSRASTPKSQTQVRPPKECHKPNVTPLGFYERPEVHPIITIPDEKTSPGPSRYPTADPASRKPPARGLFPPDDRSSALRPQSTGW